PDEVHVDPERRRGCRGRETTLLARHLAKREPEPAEFGWHEGAQVARFSQLGQVVVEEVVVAVELPRPRVESLHHVVAENRHSPMLALRAREVGARMRRQVREKGAGAWQSTTTHCSPTSTGPRSTPFASRSGRR